MRKKGQLELMQNAFVLITIFVILTFALVFVIVIQKQDQIDKMRELEELELIKKSQILNFIPEMQCTSNENVVADCYDILKVVAFQEELEEESRFEKSRYYHDLLGFLNITIRKFNPSPDTNAWVDQWNVYDNPPEDMKGITYVHYPVLLRDPVNDSDYFGVIRLGVYR